MKLHILSDLHLEFSPFTPPATDADVIILPGDIQVGNKGINWARETFPDKPILFVPGNHEFYKSNRLETLSLLRDAGKQHNVQILDDDEFILQQDRVRFLGCTLWTDFRLQGDKLKERAMLAGQMLLNDFRLIKDAGAPNGSFSPEFSVGLHEHSLAWLKAKLDEPFDGKTVVITHHLPSMQSVVTRFKDDIMSACFASELDELFGKMELWIHGHTHDNLDYVVNGTRVICNPRGYVISRRAENAAFNPGLVVEIENRL
jgi:predicted phosphodiesterase